MVETMSAFATLLTQATNTLRARQRRAVALHFDFEPDAVEGRTWAAWYYDLEGRPVMFHGRSGEESLRNLADSLSE